MLSQFCLFTVLRNSSISHFSIRNSSAVKLGVPNRLIIDDTVAQQSVGLRRDQLCATLQNTQDVAANCGAKLFVNSFQ